MASHSRREFVIAAGAGATALAAGCTGLTGSGGDDTLVVGATVSRTGAFSSAGADVETAYKLGRDVINENGGILGRDVELVMEDDESSPKGVREGLQRITSNHDVDVLWGTFGSLLVGAGASFAENEGIPFLSANFAYMQPHVENEYDWVFAPFPKSRDMANTSVKLSDMAAETGDRPERVGIWRTNTGWGAELSRVWSEALENNGHEVVLDEEVSIGTKDFSTLISQTKSADVEYLLANLTPADGITAVKQMRESNYLPKLCCMERAATITTWLGATGGAGAYMNAVPGWVPGMVDNGNDEMLSAFRAMDDTDEYPSPTVGGSYNVAQTAKQAFEAAGSVEHDAVRQALSEGTFETVIGEFSFDEYGMASDGDLAPPTGQWQDGMLRLVVPADVESEASTDLTYPIPPYEGR